MSDRGSMEGSRSSQRDTAIELTSSTLNEISRRADVTRTTAEEKKYEKFRDIESNLKKDREKLERKFAGLRNTLSRARYSLDNFNSKATAADKTVQEMYNTIYNNSTDGKEIKSWKDKGKEWDKRLLKWDERIGGWDEVVTRRLGDVWGTRDDEENVVDLGWMDTLKEGDSAIPDETLSQMKQRLDIEKDKQKTLHKNLDKLGEDIKKVDEGLNNITTKFDEMLDAFSTAQRASHVPHQHTDLKEFKIQAYPSRADELLADGVTELSLDS